MNPIHRAIERASAYFDVRDTRAGVVARQLLGRSRADDERLTALLVRELRAKIRSDGSVGGDLVATAWLAWELMDLGLGLGDEPVRRTVKWLLGRQDKDGSQNCLPRRHEITANAHSIGGFFSYRSSGRTVRLLVLPNGSSAVSDQGARFMASCYALLTVVGTGEGVSQPPLTAAGPGAIAMGPPALC